MMRDEMIDPRTRLAHFFERNATLSALSEAEQET